MKCSEKQHAWGGEVQQVWLGGADLWQKGEEGGGPQDTPQVAKVVTGRLVMVHFQGEEQGRDAVLAQPDDRRGRG